MSSLTMALNIMIYSTKTENFIRYFLQKQKTLYDTPYTYCGYVHVSESEDHQIFTVPRSEFQ